MGRSVIIIAVLSFIVALITNSCDGYEDDPFNFTTTRVNTQINDITVSKPDSSISVKISFGGGLGQEINFLGVCWKEGSEEITLETPGILTEKKNVSYGLDINSDGKTDVQFDLDSEAVQFITFTLYYTNSGIFRLRPYFQINGNVFVYGDSRLVDTR